MNKKLLAIFFAIAAAALYAINIPLSKLLLNHIDPTMLASYLYLGAGVGIGIVFLITRARRRNHTIEHEHPHNHYLSDHKHQHHHRTAELRDK